MSSFEVCGSVSVCCCGVGGSGAGDCGRRDLVGLMVAVVAGVAINGSRWRDSIPEVRRSGAGFWIVEDEGDGAGDGDNESFVGDDVRFLRRHETGSQNSVSRVVEVDARRSN